jgi:hypothetical protein
MAPNDDRARFRVKTASFEVEFEGPAQSASSKYDAMVLHLSLAKLTPLEADDSSAPVNAKSKRGGIRSSVISEALDKLIDEGWLKTKRTHEGIFVELQNRRVPGVEKGNVKVALDRRVRNGRLKSIRDGDDWVYWSS